MADDKNLEQEPPEAAEPKGVGWHLRQAREGKGLSIEQIAAETRISKRHIESIEAGRFEELPGRTYAIGFSRTIAKTVGLDQADVAAMVREEIQDDRLRERQAGNGSGTFEPGDPARAPGGRLVWFSLFAVLLLLFGIFFAARAWFSPAAELPSLAAETSGEVVQNGRAGEGVPQISPNSETAPVDAAGPVVFTAEGEVWVRFYDAQNRVLSEQTLKQGDSYTVPADAVGPKIMTGRPNLLAITIGGRSVPRLSDELVTVQDVEVSAQALRARERPTPVAAANAAD
jgi:cytoskeletal protein RodZ